MVAIIGIVGVLLVVAGGFVILDFAVRAPAVFRDVPPGLLEFMGTVAFAVVGSGVGLIVTGLVCITLALILERTRKIDVKLEEIDQRLWR